jgi:membrane protein implicated in regulation of membrane protease activity
VTTTFLVIGGIGVFLLAASLLFGSHVHVGHLHFHLPAHWHLEHGHGGHVGHDGSDTAFSLPSIAGFIGAFGFGGAIAASLLPGDGALLPSLIGLGAALPTAWGAARLTRAAMNMPTDATPERTDVIGALGVVIRAIPEQGYGEVRVRFAGQLMKFHARAANPLPAGAEILVVDAPTSTSVVVEAATPLLG